LPLTLLQRVGRLATRLIAASMLLSLSGARARDLKAVLAALFRAVMSQGFRSADQKVCANKRAKFLRWNTYGGTYN